MKNKNTKLCKEHFHNHFNDPNASKVLPFVGEPKKLKNRITMNKKKKKKKTVRRMKINKAMEDDGI